MLKNNPLYERLLDYSQSQGIKNIPALSTALGYDKPERLYRLNRSIEARPSFEVIEGLAELFPNLNLRWLISGMGPMEIPNIHKMEEDLDGSMVEEPAAVYKTRSSQQKQLLSEKERIISQQQETINALNEAYRQLKLRFEEQTK